MAVVVVDESMAYSVKIAMAIVGAVVVAVAKAVAMAGVHAFPITHFVGMLHFVFDSGTVALFFLDPASFFGNELLAFADLEQLLTLAF